MDYKLPSIFDCTIAIIGLGYVGLPLALEFSNKKFCIKTNKKINRKVIGFDINEKRIGELLNGYDRTNEVTKELLNDIENIVFTNDKSLLNEADIFIVTVPTPINESKIPDLNPLKGASKTVGEALKLRVLNQNSSTLKSCPIVIYESTVFPGATEEVCVPIIEKESELIFNNSNREECFYCGYSPERINPGDRNRKLKDIVKVTSGSNAEVAEFINNLYGSIIDAGTFPAASIKVAEAAKVIENTQRDLNIALINELSIICHKVGIDTLDVLNAAGTKWNFLNFTPGLVGGHCIGVDPYYLTFKSEQLGYSPQIVLAGRRLNDSISSWIIQRLIKRMANDGLKIKDSRLLLLGLSFKENCPDLRNTKVIDLIKELNNYGINPTIVDPWVDEEEAELSYGIKVIKDIPNEEFEVIILAVAHNQFNKYKTSHWRKILKEKHIIFDLKGIIPRELNPMRF